MRTMKAPSTFFKFLHFHISPLCPSHPEHLLGESVKTTDIILSFLCYSWLAHDPVPTFVYTCCPFHSWTTFRHELFLLILIPWNLFALSSLPANCFLTSFAFCSEFLVLLFQHWITSGFLKAHFELTLLTLSLYFLCIVVRFYLVYLFYTNLVSLLDSSLQTKLFSLSPIWSLWSISTNWQVK